MSPVIAGPPPVCGNKRTTTGTVTCQRLLGHDTKVLNHAARDASGNLLNWGTHT